MGGRILYGESLANAVDRHLVETLADVECAIKAGEPFFVNQYFPETRVGMGVDPRKHAVAVCFIVDLPADAPDPIPGRSEALDFRWFPAAAVPSDVPLWPGTRLMLQRANLTQPSDDEIVTYEALTARAISHNELMWQTPVLAMTAMAFLLTIALGQSTNWMRCLASALSAMVAVISAQLMAKHSANQLLDSEALERIEIRRGMQVLHAKPTSTLPAGLAEYGLQRRLAEKRSRVWWFRALIIMALASAAVTAEAGWRLLGG